MCDLAIIVPDHGRHRRHIRQAAEHALRLLPIAGTRLAEHVIVRPRLAATLATVDLAKALQLEQPVVEMVGSFAERVLDALVWPGDIAVERHRDVEPQLAHTASCRRPKTAHLVSGQVLRHGIASRSAQRNHPPLSGRVSARDA